MVSLRESSCTATPGESWSFVIEVLASAGRSCPGWVVESATGTTEELHQLAMPAERTRTVRVMRPTDPAIVLGSSQPETDIDARVAAERGLAVTRRRSGGGAVLVLPDEQLWIDFAIPRGDPLWDDDIVSAAVWVGDAWADALGSVGVGDPFVHRGRLLSTTWSSLVCFAGVGPGEVVAAGRKVMGLSQRRTRDWTRIQSAVHLRWRPEVLVESLSMEAATRRRCLGDLGSAVLALDMSSDSLLRALLGALPV